MRCCDLQLTAHICSSFLKWPFANVPAFACVFLLGFGVLVAPAMAELAFRMCSCLGIEHLTCGCGYCTSDVTNGQEAQLVVTRQAQLLPQAAVLPQRPQAALLTAQQRW